MLPTSRLSEMPELDAPRDGEAGERGGGGDKFLEAWNFQGETGSWRWLPLVEASDNYRLGLHRESEKRRQCG